MKAPKFAYCRPSSLDEALAILADSGADAVPLAGGQSLLPALNMRLSTPDLLVDIGELGELKGIAVAGEFLRIGALTRHVELLESALIRERLPLLAEAIGHVGHVAIRNRGTIGGSLAFADPAAELPACTVALDGTVVAAGRAGRREIPAAKFFTGPLETALRPGELIVEIRLPARQPGQLWAFAELSRRHGDFAVAGLAAIAGVADRKLADARFVYFGCTDRARPAEAVGSALRGQRLPLEDRELIAKALETDLDPSDSPGWKSATKRHLARVLTERALAAMQRQMSQ